jgi:hypothetical protein
MRACACVCVCLAATTRSESAAVFVCSLQLLRYVHFKYTSLTTVSSLHKPRVVTLHRRREYTCISISRLWSMTSLICDVTSRIRDITSSPLSVVQSLWPLVAILLTVGAYNCKLEPFVFHG